MSWRSFGLWSLSALLCAAHVRAASVPLGFVDREISGEYTSPTTLTSLPDGRVLVVQQNGVIRLIQGDELQSASFWEVPSVDSSGERGCLGIVADPDFANNHHIYLYCTIKEQSSSNNHLIRVTEASGKIESGSDKVLLMLPAVTSIWHMGGALRFGPDGMLYVAVGNHEDDPQPVETSHSQNLSNPFGKILRIRSDGSVPSDNPFVDKSGAYGAIWSYGFRNPFSFDIQPSTGRLLAGDVGQGSWEEVDDVTRGANYGWPAVEGPSDNAAYKKPLYAYTHQSGRCAITGTAFYEPKTAQFPESYVGKFLFQDFCTGVIQVLDPSDATVRPFVTGIGFPTNMTVAPDGSIYYLSRNQDTMTHEPGVGRLNKLVYTGSAAPRFSHQPDAQTVYLGDAATFTVTVEGADQLQWQRDGVDIPGATGSSYELQTTTDHDDGAMFSVVATNTAGSTKSQAVRLTITTNRPPVVQIVPGSGAMSYAPGDMLSFSGKADDPMDGALPESAFTWQVDFQHDTHAHPFVAAMSGHASLSFEVPDFEVSEANTWLRVSLTAKDSDGASQTVTRDVFPSTQLSSLEPRDPQNAWGPFEKNRSNGEDQAGDGKALSIGGIPFPTGLGVHAPSELTYELGGRCGGKFLANVGVDDEVADLGSIVFQVYLDGKLAYDSGLLHGSDGRSIVALDVAGTKLLRLVVTDGGDGMGSDHGDWGAARVTGCMDSSATQPGSSSTAAGSAAPQGSAGMSGSQAGKPAADGGSAPKDTSTMSTMSTMMSMPDAPNDDPQAATPNGPNSMSSTSDPDADDAGVASNVDMPHMSTAGSYSDHGAGQPDTPTKKRDSSCTAVSGPRSHAARDMLSGALALLALGWRSARRRRRSAAA